jgi:hypothetical protein
MYFIIISCGYASHGTREHYRLHMLPLITVFFINLKSFSVTFKYDELAIK